MDYRFKSDEWERLAPSQRIYRCRLLAEEARQVSRRASPELMRTYLDLANQWSKLAGDLEKSLLAGQPWSVK